MVGSTHSKLLTVKVLSIFRGIPPRASPPKLLKLPLIRCCSGTTPHTCTVCIPSPPTTHTHTHTHTHNACCMLYPPHPTPLHPTPRPPQLLRKTTAGLMCEADGPRGCLHIGKQIGRGGYGVVHAGESEAVAVSNLYCRHGGCSSVTLYCLHGGCSSVTLYCHHGGCNSVTLYCHHGGCSSVTLYCIHGGCSSVTLCCLPSSASSQCLTLIKSIACCHPIVFLLYSSSTPPQ